MPLRKLWNALRGTPTKTNETESPAEVRPQAAKPSGDFSGELSGELSVDLSGKLPSEVLNKPAKGRKKSARSAPAAKTRPEPLIEPTVAKEESPKPIKAKSLFGRRSSNRYAALIRQIDANVQPSQTIKVLEIGVGDGSRAIEVMTHLQSVNDVVRYAAIDQFEAGGGATKLMEFHRTLRSAEIRPQVFPETIAAGLSQVGRTIGGIDLILVSKSYSGDLESFETQLSRIAHPRTVVLVGDDASWTPHRLSRTDLNEDLIRNAA